MRLAGVMSVFDVAQLPTQRYAAWVTRSEEMKEPSEESAATTCR